MKNRILGISAYYHDSAAALLQDGQITAAAQEERFSRKKFDAGFPKKSIEYCLKQAECEIKDISAIVFYDKPFLTFERLLETYLAYAPRGFSQFLKSMPLWLKQKLDMRSRINYELKKNFDVKKKQIPKVYFTYHHESHAAAAYYSSQFSESAILCIDGVGEWATTSLWHGKENKLNPMSEIHFPHSLGLLYSAFTYYCGFRVNSGEYKLMGLAPYGKPKYVDKIKLNLIDIKQDGSFRLNMNYFDYAFGLKMTNNKFNQLFGKLPRQPESGLDQFYKDMARSIQVVTEEVILKLAKTAKEKTNSNNLCLSGGVALNCVANGQIVKEKIFENVWVPPAPGDAGGAIGAAYSYWHQYLEKPLNKKDGCHTQNSYLGPDFSDDEIQNCLTEIGANFEELEEEELLQRVATLIDQQKVVAWFQGRMEFGPRALGNRSFLGDPRSPDMQKNMNLKIKFRESFRPFAPSVLNESKSTIYSSSPESPYMSFVAQTEDNRYPAVTHVDQTARLQTVTREQNLLYCKLIEKFKNLTGTPLVINTSFNVRGEPIVCSPEDAFRCFMATQTDYLVCGSKLLDKSKQPDHLRIKVQDISPGLD